MKKIVVIIVTFIIVVGLALYFGYHIEYDTEMTDKEITEYFEKKDSDSLEDVIRLIKDSKIENTYCRKSNRQSIIPYLFVNQWLIIELKPQELNGNYYSSFKKTDISEDFLFQEMKKELSELTTKKDINWCQAATDDETEWFETYSYFDDLCVKLSTPVYIGVNNKTGSVYIISYQVR